MSQVATLDYLTTVTDGKHLVNADARHPETGAKPAFHINLDRFPDAVLEVLTAAERNAVPDAIVYVEGTSTGVGLTVPQVADTDWLIAKPTIKGPGVLLLWRTWHGGKHIWSGSWTPKAR
jgi:hypothetical protein